MTTELMNCINGGTRVFPIRVTSNAIVEPLTGVTLVAGGSGLYTFTFTDGGLRTPVVLGYIPLTANLQAQLSTVANNSIAVTFTNNSGTGTNTDFHITVLLYDRDTTK